jgi:hypothetical protein
MIYFKGIVIIELTHSEKAIVDDINFSLAT